MSQHHYTVKLHGVWGPSTRAPRFYKRWGNLTKALNKYLQYKLPDKAPDCIDSYPIYRTIVGGHITIDLVE